MQYFDQIENIMVRSGQLVMQYFRQDLEVYCKIDGSLATNVDIENEIFLQQELLRIMPDAGIVAEESGAQNEDREYMWVIDPLDGTKNFIQGIPHFCICIALTFRGEPIVGAIYNPITKDLYYAEKGLGAWLNGKNKIAIQDQNFENTGVLVVVDDLQLKHIKLQQELESGCNNLQISNRYFGCAGLDSVYVAAGYLNFIVFENIAWWDVAAGMLLIEQAGGMVDWKIKSSKKSISGRFIAGHPSIFKQFYMIVDSKICN